MRSLVNWSHAFRRQSNPKTEARRSRPTQLSQSGIDSARETRCLVLSDRAVHPQKPVVLANRTHNLLNSHLALEVSRSFKKESGKAHSSFLTFDTLVKHAIASGCTGKVTLVAPPRTCSAASRAVNSVRPRSLGLGGTRRPSVSGVGFERPVICVQSGDEHTVRFRCFVDQLTSSPVVKSRFTQLHGSTRNYSGRPFGTWSSEKVTLSRNQRVENQSEKFCSLRCCLFDRHSLSQSSRLEFPPCSLMLHGQPRQS
jgi:hypothetical protein